MGPEDDHRSVRCFMYLNAFTYNRVGYAATIAVMLAVSILCVIGVIQFFSERGNRR